jgi:hypothetical protein
MRFVKGRTSFSVPLLCAAVFAVCTGTPLHAQADEEPKVAEEGLPHLIDLALLGHYERVTEPHKAHSLADVGAFDLRSRVYLGRSIAYCAGLDGQVGGSDEGFVYGATAYLAGLGLRWGDASVVSLCGGAGIDRYGTAAPLAARFPADLSVAFDAGPLRPILWLRPAWLAATDRRKGSSISFVDELEAGLAVRFARQHRYWAHLTGGGGLAVGISYRELFDTRAVGAYFGFEFAGGQ